MIARTARQTILLAFNASRPSGVLSNEIGIGKKRDDRDAKSRCFLSGLRGKIGGEAFHSRHRGNGFSPVLTINNENGPDEIGGRQSMLGDQTARPIVAAQAAHTNGWETVGP